MKKLLFTLFALICTMSINAQVIKVMKGDVVVDTYTAEEANQVLFVEPLTPDPGILTFTATGESTIKINLADTQYKTTTQDWTDYTANEVITLQDGEFVQFKAASSSTRQNLGSNSFVMTGSLNASDNIMSLLGAGQPLGASAFSYLFEDCASLKTAPELPATTMANFCYLNMFKGCTGLTAAPALPATALANSCYFGMFDGCTNLTSVPATLSATVLKDRCYYSMFANCTSLETAPAISGTTLDQYCCSCMFEGCTSLTTAPATLPATVLANGCYQSMFYGCTSLTTAPVLPATSLVAYCYDYMFGGCTSLSSMDVAFTAWDPTTATSWWLDEVSATGTFKCPSDLPETRSASKIPTGWTIVKPAPITGTAKRTGNIDVTWVQLWDNGPKFAKYNVGASTETQYGGYYCYGSSIDRDPAWNYMEDNRDINSSEDTATNIWGSSWRMPTSAELQGLLNNCDVVWTTVSGVKGRKYTGRGKYASNSIFLPASGSSGGSDVSDSNTIGKYLSSTHYDDWAVRVLEFTSSSQKIDMYGSRGSGQSVRPVLVE